MTIVLTGASGDLGRRTAEHLLALAPPQEVVLVSRNPAALADLEHRGAEVRVGDFDDPTTLGAAFAGAETLMLISTGDVGNKRRRQHEAAIAAAVGAGVRRIVYTSSVGMHPGNPCFVIPDHRYTEGLLAGSGVAFTVLRMSSYSDILAKALAPHAVATGEWLSSAGDGLVGFVAKDDCARAAAGALTTTGHDGATYEITGPELLSHGDAAALASELSGKPIAYMAPEVSRPGAPTDSLRANEDQASTWIGSHSMDQLNSFEVAVREGYYAICTRAVEMITGRPARTLRDVYLDNLELLTGGPD